MNKMLNLPQRKSVRHSSRPRHATFPYGAFPNVPYPVL